MRVGIDLTSWSNRRGYGRFTRGLVPALLAAGDTHDWTLLVDAQTAREELPAAGRKVVMPTREAPARSASASGRRSLHDLWAMRRAVARQPLDALFFPTVYTYFPVATRATVILGIHDVIAEEFPHQVFPARYRRWLWSLKSRLARRRADWLMTVSGHARRGLIRRFGWPEERVWVVGEAPDPAFEPSPPDPEVLARWRLEGARYFVYLGGFNPHKNLVALLDAFAAVRAAGPPDLRLVLVGELEADPFTPGLGELRRRLAELGLGESVVFTGFVEDREARHLLAGALALVLPSLAEGYGLPAVEAAACGTPVVATSNSPLPEILAGGGLFVDPRRPPELTGAMARLLAEPELRRELGRTGRQRAGALDWRRSAAQFLELLERVERAAG